MQEKDFESRYMYLEKVVCDSRYINICNLNEEIKIIWQYIILFKHYYAAVKTLLAERQSAAVYSISRSACECFASIYRFVEAFGNQLEFDKIKKAEYNANISQLYCIYSNMNDSTIKANLLARIKNLLININEITGATSDENIIKKCKNYNKNISLKVMNAFKHIPEYVNDEESYKNLYPELCLYSHNNIDSIIERYYRKDEEKIVFDANKEDKNIQPLKFMFVACSNYIIKWIDDKLKNDDFFV